MQPDERFPPFAPRKNGADPDDLADDEGEKHTILDALAVGAMAVVGAIAAGALARTFVNLFMLGWGFF